MTKIGKYRSDSRTSIAKSVSSQKSYKQKEVEASLAIEELLQEQYEELLNLAENLNNKPEHQQGHHVFSFEDSPTIDAKFLTNSHLFYKLVNYCLASRERAE